MARIEWTRYSGDDVEAVVALLVNRERTNSVRITPSRGDGGVDILERNARGDGRDEVHQVKRYTDPLTAKQKTDVEGSLKHLVEDPRWQELAVGTWYLTTPWDPTPEADTWLQDLATRYKVTAVWHGLTYVEQLAARFPDVIDYYLNGDRKLVDETYRSVLAALGLSNIETSLDVPGVTERIKAALPVLNHDPYYRFELHFGEGDFPEFQPRPGSVMTSFVGEPDGGAWTAVDIIARCEASTQLRPITITGEIAIEPGSEFEEAIRDFQSYGTPFVSPDGVYSGVIDAPGGLGGRIENAKIWTLPAPGENLGNDPQLRVQMYDPSGAALGGVDLDRTARSEAADGRRTVLTEIHNVFDLEDRYNRSGGGSRRKLQFHEITGKPVLHVHEALTFVLASHAPNVARVSVRGTPPELGLVDKSWAFPVEDPALASVKRSAHAVGVLARIQRFTRTMIRVPDFTKVSPADVEAWANVAAVLEGKEVAATYPEGTALTIGLDDEFVFPKDGVGVEVDFDATVGDQVIQLGKVHMWLENATLIERERRDGVILHHLTTPGRAFTYKRIKKT
jgi:hypothetical protein